MSSTHEKKILVIFGATGIQGGSIIAEILADKNTAEKFEIHAVTRDTTKPAAKALEERGVKVVQADLNDKNSIVNVLKEAYAVFAVTNFWEFLDKNIEVVQGKNIADAAKATNIQHLIWSSLPSPMKISNNKYTKVAHFDGKADVEAYIESLGLPATYLLIGTYMSWVAEQYIQRAPSTSSPSGHAFHIKAPVSTTIKLPLINTEADLGVFVKGILLHREETLGKQILAAQAYYTADEMMATLKSVHPDLGADTRVIQISDEEYLGGLQKTGLPVHIAEEMIETVKYIEEFEYFEGKELTAAPIVDRPLTTWEEYVKTSPHLKD